MIGQVLFWFVALSAAWLLGYGAGHRKGFDDAEKTRE